jgi:hypothetical protein
MRSFWKVYATVRFEFRYDHTRNNMENENNTNIYYDRHGPADVCIMGNTFWGVHEIFEAVAAAAYLYILYGVRRVQS